MTRPRIETRSPRQLTNTLFIRPMTRLDKDKNIDERCRKFWSVTLCHRICWIHLSVFIQKRAIPFSFYCICVLTNTFWNICCWAYLWKLRWYCGVSYGTAYQPPDYKTIESSYWGIKGRSFLLFLTRNLKVTKKKSTWLFTSDKSTGI